MTSEFGSRSKSPPCTDQAEYALRKHTKKAVTYWIDYANAHLLPANQAALERSSCRPRLSVEACDAEAFVSVPAIRFDLTGQTAGMAVYDRRGDPRDRALVRINAALLRDNPKHIIQQTVPHEVAHVVSRWLWGKDIRPHGHEWKSVMRKFGKQPTRCHTMDTTSSRRLPTYSYRCACQNLTEMTSIRHRRAQAACETGRHAYSCRRCRRPFVYASD